MTENTVGIILSFPSTRILKPGHVAAATAVGIRTILLWGPKDLWRKAALERNDGRVTTEAQYDKAIVVFLRRMLSLNTTKYALIHFVMGRDCHLAS
jgi:hypothetical protein